MSASASARRGSSDRGSGGCRPPSRLLGPNAGPGIPIPSLEALSTPVVSIIEAENGEARSAVLTDVWGAMLRKVLAGHVDLPRAHLVTDEHRGYFRYSTLKLSDAEGPGMLVDRMAGLRVTYKRVKRA